MKAFLTAHSAPPGPRAGTRWETAGSPQRQAGMRWQVGLQGQAEGYLATPEITPPNGLQDASQAHPTEVDVVYMSDGAQCMCYREGRVQRVGDGAGEGRQQDNTLNMTVSPPKGTVTN